MRKRKEVTVTLSALTVWELGRECGTLEELSHRIGQSDVAAFEFPNELVFDMWGVIDDWRHGRLRPRLAVPFDIDNVEEQ